MNNAEQKQLQLCLVKESLTDAEQRQLAEQAQIYMAQDSTCRAVALWRKLVRVKPSAENLTMLAEA